MLGMLSYIVCENLKERFERRNFGVHSRESCAARSAWKLADFGPNNRRGPLPRYKREFAWDRFRSQRVHRRELDSRKIRAR